MKCEKCGNDYLRNTILQLRRFFNESLKTCPRPARVPQGNDVPSNPSERACLRGWFWQTRGCIFVDMVIFSHCSFADTVVDKLFRDMLR
jgi:hypothetical protein